MSGLAKYVLASAAVIAPCFWHERIQAGDLASHAYNAWLALLIEAGQAPGLALAPQSTNFLFDALLTAAMRIAGPSAAQRAAVAACVLIFFWGAFSFGRKTSGREPWAMAPLLAMLSYGFVFHVGFFNFYLGLGLSLWAMTLAWDRPSRRAWPALAILALAWTAHALPVIWAAGCTAFVWLHRRWLLWAGIGALVALRLTLQALYPIRWLPTQIYGIAGTDQFWIYTPVYAIVSLAATILMLAMLRRAPKLHTELGVLSAAAVVLIPTGIYLPGYRPGLVYIAERMSLTVPLALLPSLAAARPGRRWQLSLAALAALYFALLFQHTRALNRVEDAVTRAARSAPAHSRVAASLDDPSVRLNALVHMVDRACIGHCFSYANYEPSSAAFRVRVAGATPVVMSDYHDSFALQTGQYTVKPRDLPLYVVDVCESGLCARPAAAGERIEQRRISINDPRWR